MIFVDCEPEARSSTHRPIILRNTNEHRLGALLEQLGLVDCLAPLDNESDVAALSIVAPREVSCDREVESFSGPASVLRHQVGHRLWERLIGQSDHVAPFALAFGATKTSTALEQWAEAFDAYMQILDIAGTAAERGLLVLRGQYDPIALPFAAIFDHALPYLGAIPASARDGIARKGVGVTANKLAFVHGRVSAHGARARFSYALD